MNPPPRRRPVPAEPAGIPSLRERLARRGPGIGAAAVLVAAVVAGLWLWSRYGERARGHGEFVLVPDQVMVRGVAPWVRSDVKAEALRTASLDHGLPLDDPHLERRLARAFEMHPWVRRVVAVRTRHPAAADVEIECREPVAMVGVEGGLLAVDGEGVVLPSGDFDAATAARFPKIRGIASSPQGPEGTPWGDEAVVEGAALAAAIGPEWEPLSLVECRPTLEQNVRCWELVADGGRTFRFGSAPGSEAEGEPTAAVKIGRLRTAARGAEGAEPVDLRRGPDPEAQPRSIPVPAG